MGTTVSSFVTMDMRNVRNLATAVSLIKHNNSFACAPFALMPRMANDDKHLKSPLTQLIASHAITVFLKKHNLIV